MCRRSCAVSRQLYDCACLCLCVCLCVHGLGVKGFGQSRVLLHLRCFLMGAMSLASTLPTVRSPDWLFRSIPMISLGLTNRGPSNLRLQGSSPRLPHPRARQVCNLALLGTLLDNLFGAILWPVGPRTRKLPPEGRKALKALCALVLTSALLYSRAVQFRPYVSLKSPDIGNHFSR